MAPDPALRAWLAESPRRCPSCGGALDDHTRAACSGCGRELVLELDDGRGASRFARRLILLTSVLALLAGMSGALEIRNLSGFAWGTSPLHALFSIAPIMSGLIAILAGITGLAALLLHVQKRNDNRSMTLALAAQSMLVAYVFWGVVRLSLVFIWFLPW